MTLRHGVPYGFEHSSGSTFRAVRISASTTGHLFAGSPTFQIAFSLHYMGAIRLPGELVSNLSTVKSASVRRALSFSQSVYAHTEKTDGSGRYCTTNNDAVVAEAAGAAAAAKIYRQGAPRSTIDEK